MKTLDYPIRVPSDVLEALGEFTGHNWSDALALEPFVCEAIRNYLRPAPAAQAQTGSSSSGAGYQWKQLFLPKGTRLRASFGGRSYFANVEDDAIQYGGRAMSPSQFANLQGSGNRNAWKAIWLCLPGSGDWLLADVCRTAQKAAILRLLEGGAPPQRVLPLLERRTAERRKASHAANDKTHCEPRCPAPRQVSQRSDEAHHRPTGKDLAPVAWAAMTHNSAGFKLEPRRSRSKRSAKLYRPGMSRRPPEMPFSFY